MLLSLKEWVVRNGRIYALSERILRRQKQTVFGRVSAYVEYSRCEVLLREQIRGVD